MNPKARPCMRTTFQLSGPVKGTKCSSLCKPQPPSLLREIRHIRHITFRTLHLESLYIFTKLNQLTIKVMPTMTPATPPMNPASPAICATSTGPTAWTTGMLRSTLATLRDDNKLLPEKGLQVQRSLKDKAERPRRW